MQLTTHRAARSFKTAPRCIHLWTFLNVSRTWIFHIGNLLLLYFTENGLAEEEREHQVEVQSASQSNLQDAARGKLSTEEAGEDMHPGVAQTLQKPQGPQPILQESQEAESEVHELESDGKQEKEDQVETFFSSMSHRYEEPLAL